MGGQRLVRSVTGVEPRRTVNPDEAVSLGATSLFSEHHSSALLFLNLSFHHAVYVGGVL